MTLKKNVLFVVKRRFTNMEKDEESVLNAEKLLGSAMANRSIEEEMLKNGF